MEQRAQEEYFVLDVTHSLTSEGLQRCSDFWKDPPRDGRIVCSIRGNGVLVLKSCTSDASAEIPKSEWKKL